MNDLISYIEKFSSRICSVNNEDKTFKAIEKYFKRNPIKDDGLNGRVWILIGKDENFEYCSLMVAQSENIKTEIVDDVSAMFNLEYRKQKSSSNEWDIEKEIKYNLDIIKSPQIAEINSNENIYLYPDGQYRIRSQYLYRYLKKKYRDLKIYEVNIDVYLGMGTESDEKMDDIKRVYELGKDYYAESKLAVETQSLFWNYYKSGVGKRAYYYFRNQTND